MSTEAASFDVEAQESLLPPDTPAVQDEDEISNNGNGARNTLLKFVLLIRSTQLFKLGVDYAASASPTYASINTSHQGSEIVEVSTDSTASDDNHIELQQLQRKNIIEIIRKKDLQQLQDFGGVEGVAEALNTHLKNNGVSSSSSSPRQPKLCKLSQFLSSFLKAFYNTTILLLSCAAALSLGFGIKEDGLHTGWVNGAVLLATIFFIVVGTTIRNCWDAWSHNKLMKEMKLNVLVDRGGQFLFVSEIDLEVGDLVLVQRGDQVLADGLFVSGQGLQLDEGLINPTSIDENNPFLFYGSRVVNGECRMLVTSTLMDTKWGEMMAQSDETECEFESYIHKLNTCVQIVGLLISILILIVLYLRYKAGKLDDERRFKPDPRGEPLKARTIMDAIQGIIITGSKGKTRVLMTLLSVSLVGIMEGIPLSIAFAAMIWSSKTLGDKASERDHFSSIKMASVTTIVTDMFGGITEHDKEINMLCIGDEFVTESSVVASQVIEGVCEGIGMLHLLPQNDREPELLLHIAWAEEKFGMKRETVIKRCKLMKHDSSRVLMEKDGNERYLHYKGRVNDVLSKCSQYHDIGGRIWKLDEEKMRKLEKVISCMVAEPSAQVVAYAYKRVNDFEHEASFEPDDLTLLVMISTRETRTEETKRAISSLKEVGITTVLASIENIDALKRTGIKCGLINGLDDDPVLTAEEFRGWSDEERTNKVEKVVILGNCLPSDKMLLIKSLQKKGHVVALLGQRTVDAPALKQANVGITYSSWSSKVARQCCEITIWHGNCFAFLVNAINNGRCFQENIRKFIQLQLILAISSSLINSIAIVLWGDAPITAIKLFWLTLVVGLVGGLALLTGPSTATLMTMIPIYKTSAKLITKAMWRNIVVQVSYQTTVFITLQHKGQAILDTSGGSIKSFIYNGFFLCQMFNKFIAREPENENIFRGLLHNNFWFWMAFVIFIICQGVVAMVDELLDTSPGLSYKLWGVCLLIGIASWLVDWVGKLGSNCKVIVLKCLTSNPFNHLWNSNSV